MQDTQSLNKKLEKQIPTILFFYVTWVKRQKDTEKKKKRPQITTRTLIFHAKEEET